MLRRFSVLRSGTNASGRTAVERQFGKSNIFARTSAKIADKLAQRRQIDDLADYVDKDLRFEFPPHFNYAMAFFTFALMTPLMYLVAEEITPPSKIVLLFGAMRQEDYDKLFQFIPWQMCSVGHAFLFAVVYIFVTPYVRYPFFVHCLAPFYRRMGWTVSRSPQQHSNTKVSSVASSSASSSAGAGWRSSNKR